MARECVPPSLILRESLWRADARLLGGPDKPGHDIAGIMTLRG
jgi:hypothetical protein